MSEPKLTVDAVVEHPLDPRNVVVEYFVDDRHALYVGWVAGIAWRNGLPVEIIADDEGNYTDRMKIPLAPNFTIIVVIPYPPDDWTFTDYD